MSNVVIQCNDGVTVDIPKCVEKHSRLVKAYKEVTEEVPFWEENEENKIEDLEIKKDEETSK